MTAEEEAPVQLDSVLQQLGAFGRHQLATLAMLSLVYATNSMYNINYVFAVEEDFNSNMALKKIMKGVPSQTLTAGYLCHDWEALTACQRECSKRFAMTIQVEQEAYLSQHPEVKAMLEIFVSKMVRANKRKGTMKEAAEHFTRPIEVLDMEIRQRLCSPSGSYVKSGYSAFKYEDKNLDSDMRNILSKHSTSTAEPLTLPVATPDTESSTFLSIVTSDTTLSTPEPIPIPEPTLSQILFTWVSNTVDKAIFSHVDDKLLLYDTAYVELSKIVEEAMEIPVIEIREDIAHLFYNAYKMFELDIMEKERTAAAIAWEKRMRKKLKRSLRRANNFKGYESPTSTKSEVSSHESYKVPPPRPCVCAPKYNYNRYPKDRFGIYLPREEKFYDGNVTATPILSPDSVTSNAS